VSHIVWWEVESPDPTVFREFHGRLWRWRFRQEFADSDLGTDYWVILDGQRGIGGLQSTQSAPAPGVRLYLEVGDLEGTLRDIERHRGRMTRRRTHLGDDDRWFAQFDDPTGISFGLWTAHPLRSREIDS
jgi:predicted enzyme related to lactoylglutathione lyase